VSVVIRIPPYERLQDPVARECFQWIIDYVQQVPLLQGTFSHFELTFLKAEASLLVPHNLGFLPEDIIVTANTGGTVTFNHQNFTSTNLSITTSGACMVRFFAGRYKRE